MMPDFDRLNVIRTVRDSPPGRRKRGVPFPLYFGIMELTELQIGERIQFAEELMDALLILFELLYQQRRLGMESPTAAIKYFAETYKQIISRYDGEEFSEYHSLEAAVEIVEASIKNADGEWYRSEDRARFVAENEANAVLNHADFERAKEAGDRYKTWITERDERVRQTHRMVDGKKIPIDSAFAVGGYLMMFPKDASMGAPPSEIVNCRCSIRYSR